MTEEKELKREGEDLAKAAVASKLGAKQLRTLLTLSKTKPLPFVEAYMQRQLARVTGTTALQMTLDLLRRYSENKATFTKILMYANMLYPYYEKEAAMAYRTIAEESASRTCEKYRCKFVGLEWATENGDLQVRVKVQRYQGDPRDLASSIMRDITSRDPKFHGRIWIEPIDRR